MNNQDLIDTLLEFEYLQREGIIFSEDENDEIRHACKAIMLNTVNLIGVPN